MARMSWRVRRGRLKLNMVACRVYRGREIVACRWNVGNCVADCWERLLSIVGK